MYEESTQFLTLNYCCHLFKETNIKKLTHHLLLKKITQGNISTKSYDACLVLWSVWLEKWLPEKEKEKTTKQINLKAF